MLGVWRALTRRAPSADPGAAAAAAADAASGKKRRGAALGRDEEEGGGGGGSGSSGVGLADCDERGTRDGSEAGEGDAASTTAVRHARALVALGVAPSAAAGALAEESQRELAASAWMRTSRVPPPPPPLPPALIPQFRAIMGRKSGARSVAGSTASHNPLSSSSGRLTGSMRLPHVSSAQGLASTLNPLLASQQGGVPGSAGSSSFRQGLPHFRRF
jgi:hypothetical protein